MSKKTKIDAKLKHIVWQKISKKIKYYHRAFLPLHQYEQSLYSGQDHHLKTDSAVAAVADGSTPLL